MSAALVLSHVPVTYADTPLDSPLLQELRAEFPGAPMVEVTWAEFEILMARNQDHAVQYAQPATEESPQNSRSETMHHASAEPYTQRDWPQPGTVVPAQTRVSSRVSLAAYGEGSGSIATDDLAVILYVLVGAVVIAAGVIYGGFILYEMITGRAEYDYWRKLSAGAWHFTGSGRKGGMYGGRASMGLLHEEIRVGLTLEAGYLDGRFRLRHDDRFMSVHGFYALLGPTVHWELGEGDNPLAFDVELLTGYSTANRVGLMSRAMGGLSWGLGSRWRLGVQLGSTYAKIRESEGPLTTKSDFNLTVGGWLGATF